MLTDEEFRLFRNLIYNESGMYLKESKKDFLEHRLSKRMTAMKTASPYWYYRLVTEEKKSELLILLDVLTVNETSFFRNGPQLDLFKKVILPELAAAGRRDIHKSLRIWSAGCSSGEEPYTISMLVHEVIPDCLQRDIKILASDLSLRALETAAKGVYAADKLHATLGPGYIGRFFHKTGEDYAVNDEVKKMVVFDYHNLKNDNGLQALDVIFCRNVMIYFDMEEQKRLVEKFYKSLNPAGYLLIGHAESLQGMDTGFEFMFYNKGTAYRKAAGRI
jgi:chemotaxis protein methyltransferase CheR